MQYYSCHHYHCQKAADKITTLSAMPNSNTDTINKYTFLSKILSSSVKVILFIYIPTFICQDAW